MNTEFPIDIQVSVSLNGQLTLNNVYNALVNNISGSIIEGVLPAVANPQSDLSHFAPYFDGSSWNVWNLKYGTYTPIKTVIGGVVLVATPKANRIQTLQNKNGTIALLDDARGIRETITLQEGLVSVDWDMGSSFMVVLSQDRESAFYMQHSKAGMEIRILIVNSGTNQVIGAWDSGIKWPAATAPTMPSSKPGAAKSLLVTLRNISGTIYGEYWTQDQSAPTDSDPPIIIGHDSHD